MVRPSLPFSCSEVFEVMLCGTLSALYDMHGCCNPLVFAQLELWAVACRESTDRRPLSH